MEATDDNEPFQKWEKLSSQFTTTNGHLMASVCPGYGHGHWYGIATPFSCLEPKKRKSPFTASRDLRGQI
jgi:hypothetical protein